MTKTLQVRPFERCPRCNRKGYRATNIGNKPIMKCKYCGLTRER